MGGGGTDDVPVALTTLNGVRLPVGTNPADRAWYGDAVLPSEVATSASWQKWYAVTDVHRDLIGPWGPVERMPVKTRWAEPGKRAQRLIVAESAELLVAKWFNLLEDLPLDSRPLQVPHIHSLHQQAETTSGDSLVVHWR